MDQLEEGDYTPHGSIQLPIGLVTSFVGRYINCVYSYLQGSAYQGAVDLPPLSFSSSGSLYGDENSRFASAPSYYLWIL